MIRVIWIVLVFVAFAAVVSELGAPAIDTEHLLAGLLKEPAEPLRALFATVDLSYDRFGQTLQTHAEPIPESIENTCCSAYSGTKVRTR